MTTKTLTLQDLATECMAKFQGDVDGAVDHMVERLTTDTYLYEHLALPILREASRTRCRNVRSHYRRESIEGRGQATPMSDNRRKAIVRGAINEQRHLMDFPLPDGTIMRDATKAILGGATDFYLKQSRTMMVRGFWFRLVSDKLPDDKTTVGKALSEEDLNKLYERADKKK